MRQVLWFSSLSMINLDQLELHEIRQCLKRSSDHTLGYPHYWTSSECTSAAVLIPLLRQHNQWHLLFIRRAEHERDEHSGQVAFAGGKYESIDKDMQDTALREANEEIGIHPQHVTILGKLGYQYSITRFEITPVVAHIPWPYEFSLDRKEVARVFTIPLSWLAEPDNHRVRHRKHRHGKTFPVIYFNEYEGELLWGSTARMTLSLIALLKQVL